jgi:hypothetical protein
VRSGDECGGCGREAWKGSRSESLKPVVAMQVEVGRRPVLQGHGPSQCQTGRKGCCHESRRGIVHSNCCFTGELGPKSLRQFLATIAVLPSEPVGAAQGLLSITDSGVIWRGFGRPHATVLDFHCEWVSEHRSASEGFLTSSDSPFTLFTTAPEGHPDRASCDCHSQQAYP